MLLWNITAVRRVQGGLGGLNGRGCREGHRGASCSKIQTYAIFVQFFVVFMCYTLVYYIWVYCVLVYIIIEHCVFVYFSFLCYFCVFSVIFEKSLSWKFSILQLLKNRTLTVFELQDWYWYQKKRNFVLYKTTESFFRIQNKNNIDTKITQKLKLKNTQCSIITRYKIRIILLLFQLLYIRVHNILMYSIQVYNTWIQPNIAQKLHTFVSDYSWHHSTPCCSAPRPPCTHRTAVILHNNIRYILILH